MESLFVRAGLYAITWRRGVAGGSPAHRFADGGDAYVFSVPYRVELVAVRPVDEHHDKVGTAQLPAVWPLAGADLLATEDNRLVHVTILVA